MTGKFYGKELQENYTYLERRYWLRPTYRGGSWWSIEGDKEKFFGFVDENDYSKVYNLDWTISEEEYDEADDLVEKFESKGYKISNRGLIGSLIVETPSGNLLSRDGIEKILSSNLEVGNKEQIESLRAAEYLKSFHAYMYQRGTGGGEDVEDYY